MSTRSTKNRGKRWTADERQFVKNVYPALGPAAIAKKLGRSHSGTCKLIAEMKASGEIPGGKSVEQSTGRVTMGPPADAPDGTQDTLGRLRWVRGILERGLWDAEPSQAARLAKEYRDTVAEIGRMEAREGSAADDPMERIAAALERHGEAAPAPGAPVQRRPL